MQRDAQNDRSAGRPAPDPFLGGQPVVQEKSLRDYLLMIRERWFFGAFVALLVAIPFGYFKLQEVPVYETSTMLFFENAERVIPSQEVVEGTLTLSGGNAMQGHFFRLNSGEVLQRVFESLSEDERAMIRAPYISEENPDPDTRQIIASGRNFRFGAANSPNGVSTTIILTMRHRDPEAAALLANRYAEQYQQFTVDRKGRGEESAIRYLEARVQDLEEKVSEGELALQNYREEQNMVSLEENQNLVLANLQELNSHLRSAEVSLTGIQAIMDQIKRADGDQERLLNVPAIAQYGRIPDVLSEIKGLEAVRERLSRKYLERHPSMIDNATALESQRKILGELIGEAIASIEGQYDAARTLVQRRKADQDAAEKESLRLARMAVEYDILRRQVQTDRNTLAAVQSQLNQKTLQSQLSNTIVQRLDPAGVPSRPASPNPRRIIMLSVGLFIAIFTGITIGLGMLDNKVKSVWDVETFLNRELLGAIPAVRTMERDKLPRIVLDESDDLIVEYFNSLYSQIELISRAAPPRIIVITSATAEEGKSFISSNLAASCAKHGSRTLLIDADLRSPTLARTYRVKNDAGILRWFDSKRPAPARGESLSDPDLGILPVTEDLFLLRTAGMVKRPTAMIRDERFAELLHALRADFETIIIDTPPSLFFPDAVLIADNADEIIHVCRYKGMNRNKLKPLFRKFDQTRSRMLGVIFNGTRLGDTNRLGYFDFKSYQKYTDKQERPDPKDRSRKPSKKKDREKTTAV